MNTRVVLMSQHINCPIHPRLKYLCNWIGPCLVSSVIFCVCGESAMVHLNKTPPSNTPSPFTYTDSPGEILISLGFYSTPSLSLKCRIIVPKLNPNLLINRISPSAAVGGLVGSQCVGVCCNGILGHFFLCGSPKRVILGNNKIQFRQTRFMLCFCGE